MMRTCSKGTTYIEAPVLKFCGEQKYSAFFVAASVTLRDAVVLQNCCSKIKSFGELNLVGTLFAPAHLQERKNHE